MPRKRPKSPRESVDARLEPCFGGEPVDVFALVRCGRCGQRLIEIAPEGERWTPKPMVDNTGKPLLAIGTWGRYWDGHMLQPTADHLARQRHALAHLSEPDARRR